MLLLDFALDFASLEMHGNSQNDQFLEVKARHKFYPAEI